MNIYLRMLRLAKPHKYLFLLAMLCMLLVSAAVSAQVYLIKPAMDNIFMLRDSAALKWVPIAIILVFLIKGLAEYGQSFLMTYIGQRAVFNLRNDFFRHIQLQPLAFFNNNSTGALISRITNDINLIQGAISEAVTSVLKDSFTLVGLVFVVFYNDWKLGLISCIIFPFAGFLIARFGQHFRGIATSTQVSVASLTTILQETLSGVRIVKAFGMERHESQRFASENERLFKLVMKSVGVRAFSSSLMELLAGVGMAIVIAYGGYMTMNLRSTPGTIICLTAALMMLYEPIKRLLTVNNTIQQGIVGAKRVFAFMDIKPIICDKNTAANLLPITRDIKFKNVSFSYGELPTLSDINLNIKAGSMIALVGMSGGGKTTLVNLIPRFYDVNAGCIEIDGHDIRDVTLSSLRGQIGIVTQETILFNDSVRNNIAYGDIRKPDSAVIRAAKAANAHNFIIKLPRGYDTIIGEKGVKLSGGERQRISIARALLKDAPIIILDEATSSLDTEAELEIQDALANLVKNRTTLVIAHRLSTVRNADRIIVLKQGEIVEDGAHEELMNMQGEYHRLYNLQFSGNSQHQAASERIQEQNSA